MRYAFLVAWREYSENAKTKGFWIGIFLLPAILFLSMQVPIWLEQKAAPIQYFVLLDQSGKFSAAVESSIERPYQRKLLDALEQYAHKHASGTEAAGTNDAATASSSLDSFLAQGGQEAFLRRLQLKPGAPPFVPPRRIHQLVKTPPAIASLSEPAAVAEALRPYLRAQRKMELDGQPIELRAAVLIPRDIENCIVRPKAKAARAERSSANPGEIQFWSANASDSRLREEIERIVNSEVRKAEYLARGMDAAAVREVEQTYIPFASLDPKKEKGQEAVTQTDLIKQWAPSGFVYLLWMAIFVIVQMLLNNTIEEKSNRIIEVLLSSVTPGELMMGKLCGIAAIGLTMVGAWMAALFGILGWKAGGASQLATHMLSVLNSSNLIPLFCIYFLLGYLMYAGFILSIGSVCNTIKEAQSYMSVLTMVMMVPLLTMTFIPKDPNGPLARVLSWIPVYTPFTMMNRAAADPPLLDLIGTLILLVATTAGALWMSGKIFRIGILRTGQPPRIVEMVRWALRKNV